MCAKLKSSSAKEENPTQPGDEPTTDYSREHKETSEVFKTMPYVVILEPEEFQRVKELAANQGNYDDDQVLIGIVVQCWKAEEARQRALEALRD